MKKTLIIIATIISLTSCSKETEIISKSEDHLKKVLLDESTYDLIESKIDTVRKHSSVYYDAFSDSLTADMYLKLTNDNIDYVKIWSSSSTYFGESQYYKYKNMATQYLDSAKKYNKSSKSKLEEAKKMIGTTKDSIIRYDVQLKYYSMNKSGNRAIGESTIHVNTKGEPYDISGDK
jgi:hypothetical protein